MTRGKSGAFRIDVSFDGSIMKIGIDNDFSGCSKFRVYAFDGIIKIFGDYIYVFLEGDDDVNLVFAADGVGVFINGGVFLKILGI